MPRESKVEVINRQGWRKEFVIEKPMIQIGRDARNDIVLDDGLENDLAPRHAQVLPSAVSSQGLRLVNLSDAEIVVAPKSAGGSKPEVVVGPRSSAELGNGDQVKMGGFTLIFYGGEQRSEMVQLSLDLAGDELAPDRPLPGVLTIRHVGNKAAVQFKIEVEGLEADAYEIGPGPVLFPSAEKQIAFRLLHPKRAYPPAGAHRVTFHVSAPEAYPGERASISGDIRVAPYFRHRMRVQMADAAEYRLG
jgi:hypothetical protein